MAEEQEEIVVIEEGLDAEETPSENTEETPQEADTSGNKKKIIIIVSAIFVVLLIAGGIAFALLSHSDDNAHETHDEPLMHASNPEEPKIEPSELEKMIERANALYANGNQQEALKLYEKIALYSESISQYNLGVVQLKEKEYDRALENFKRSIANGENRCVSAINAAVCCLHLDEEENFRYYIDLAHAYISEEANSPMYSYYYALINYYRGNSFEALSALNHPTTNEYEVIQKKLKAKIDTLFGNFSGAIEALEKPQQDVDAFSLGLLHANKGNLNEARNYLSSAMVQNKKPIEESLALVMVDLKLGYHQEAANILEKVTQDYPNEVYKPYPLKVSLKPSLFEPETIQKTYRTIDAKFHPQTYQKIFTFSPYKIFNASQTVDYIRKSNANIYIDDTDSAKEYLQKSMYASSVDYGIALAIQKAIHYKLKDANTQFLKLSAAHPKHSILNYNLGLSFAQLGDYNNAYTYFLRSYHLDADNYLAGIYAIMTSELISKPNPKLKSIIKENLTQENNTESIELYRTLLSMTENNYAGASRWLETRYKDRPLYLAMKTIIAQELGMDEYAHKSSLKLVQLLPNEILPHLFYIDAHYNDLPSKEFARASLNYLKNKNFSYEDLYFGSQLTRERFIHMSALTGKLTPLIMRLENKLQTTTENRSTLTSALALAYFYNQNFEQAHSLYNKLIDTYEIRDERTLFMGATASIGAGHYQNAISLLQLSKMTNPNYLESRYALGLLYMQAENNTAAVVQFSKMGDKGFKSRMFDFKIDTDKLSLEPERFHPL